MADQESRLQNSLEEIAAFGLGGGCEQDGITGPTADVRSPLGEKVRSTVKGILGARVRAEDPKGFKASLTQSFVSHEIHGKREYKWTPRSYSIEVERGMLTGAQASIHTRAPRAVQHSLALLDGLDSRSCGDCHEEFDSARAVVRGQLTELVDELGQPGGPRPGRVDVLFDQLEHQVLHLKHALGIGETVCTVETEEIATNLDIVQDYVQSLQVNWQESRKHFLRSGGNRYVGNVHYHLKRHLAVMVESVDEANRIMNKALLGPRERETLLLTLVLHHHEKGCNRCTGRCQKLEMYLSDLLTWIEHFGSKEALRLLGEGGCYGGEVVSSTLRRLARLTGETVRLSCEGPAEEAGVVRCAPSAFYSARVRCALQQLHEHVKQASSLAVDLPEPPRRLRRYDDLKDREFVEKLVKQTEDRLRTWFEEKRRRQRKDQSRSAQVARDVDTIDDDDTPNGASITDPEKTRQTAGTAEITPAPQPGGIETTSTSPPAGKSDTATAPDGGSALLDEGEDDTGASRGKTKRRPDDDPQQA